ncbi:MAG: hypothetical protein JXQ30_08375 [Spirochaetes bacterium]|nr:hypothetical protein [Spirochaetota bacterium]
MFPLCIGLTSFAWAQTEYIGRAEVSHLKWGEGGAGWEEIETMSDLKLEKTGIVLDDNSPRYGPETELLLRFDGEDAPGSPFYSIDEMKIVPSGDVSMYGGGAAGFFHGENRIVLEPMPGSLFLDDPLERFTIDFYLYPVSVREERNVFSWYAPTVDTPGFSGVRAYLRDGRLFWEFKKTFFRGEGGQPVDVMLYERVETPIGEWHHHALRYDADDGLLTLYFDGKEAALAWLTDTGSEEGSLLQGRFSPYLKAGMFIGGEYLGYIDEFRISRGFPEFFLGRYRGRGEATSKVITLPSRGTKLVNVSWKGEENDGTAIRVFCRFSDSYFLPLEDDEESGVKGPSWTRVKNGEVFSQDGPKGRYMQWKVALYGTEAKYTPRLYALDVALQLDPPPQPPTLLETDEGDKRVHLFWVRNNESDIKGYKVYYGTGSGYYFGKGAAAGDSPVWAGDVTSFDLSGLENEQVYFVSITAVDEEGQESGFSREFVARPSAVFAN